MGSRVRPTSRVNVTGTSRMTSSLASLAAMAGGCSSAAETAPPVCACSCCSSICWAMSSSGVDMRVILRGLLHHEAGEVHGFDLLGFAAFGLDDVPHGFERGLAQRLLAFACLHFFVLDVAEQQQQ